MAASSPGPADWRPHLVLLTRRARGGAADTFGFNVRAKCERGSLRLTNYLFPFVYHALEVAPAAGGYVRLIEDSPPASVEPGRRASLTAPSVVPTWSSLAGGAPGAPAVGSQNLPPPPAAAVVAAAAAPAPAAAADWSKDEMAA